MVVCSGFYNIGLGRLEQIENPKNIKLFVSNCLSSCKQGTYESNFFFAAKETLEKHLF